jgi:hypothetical protein
MVRGCGAASIIPRIFHDAEIEAVSNMSTDEPLYVDCGPHGKRVAAVVCCHMIQTRKAVGFVENSSDPNDLQAWCDKCEEMFLMEGGKTEVFEAFNDRAIVCCVCYADFKTKHSRQQPSH